MIKTWTEGCLCCVFLIDKITSRGRFQSTGVISEIFSLPSFVSVIFPGREDKWVVSPHIVNVRRIVIKHHKLDTAITASKILRLQDGKMKTMKNKFH